MARRWHQIIERLERGLQIRQNWEEAHPPITQISRQEANSKRTLTMVGQEGVACNLPCFGSNIPSEYSHKQEVVNVFNRGIIVEGWNNPEQGQSMYLGATCNLAPGKICVVRDERLRRAIER